MKVNNKRKNARKKFWRKGQKCPECGESVEDGYQNGRSKLEKRISGALKSAVDAHGPITRNNVSSASKRVIGVVKQFVRDQQK